MTNLGTDNEKWGGWLKWTPDEVIFWIMTLCLVAVVTLFVSMVMK